MGQVKQTGRGRTEPRCDGQAEPRWRGAFAIGFEALQKDTVSRFRTPIDSLGSALPL